MVGGMPVDSTRMIVAACFGLLTGWGLTRRAEQQGPILVVEALTATIGAVLWVSGPDPGSDAAVAAGSLTAGGVAALLASWLSWSWPAWSPARRRTTPTG